MLAPGTRAPPFEVSDCNGAPVRLSAYRGKRVVLFFFPKAFTPGCTEEIRHFRDNQEQITALNAVLIGVSVDSQQLQCDFARSERIDFALIGDEKHTLSEAYGVLWPLYRRNMRVTFVIDPEGVIEQVIHHERHVHRHLDDVLLALKGVPAPLANLGPQQG